MKQLTSPQYLFCILLLCLMATQMQCQEAPRTRKAPGPGRLPTEQLLLVQTAGWDAVTGYMTKYEWQFGAWQQIGEPISVNVGKNGMYWGKGLEDYGLYEPEMAKKEGDGRSPAGIFPLIAAFGYAHPDSIEGLRFPYEHVDAFTQCIEDTASPYYNKIVHGDKVKSDWTSTDFMLRKDDLYEWGIFVGHNYGSDTQAGAGSCIFLHAWREEGSGTAGCTAMEKERMKELVFWLDEKKNPILLQLPQPEYEGFKQRFVLP